MITNLQLLRALAALAVVFYHTGYTIGGAGTEFYGVNVFFCISGFMMTMVTLSGETEFMARRIARIVPAYWLITIVFFVLAKSGLLNFSYMLPLLATWSIENHAALGDWFVASFMSNADNMWGKLLFSLLFLPYVRDGLLSYPVLGVGWTLNIEMYFYVVFALCIAIHRTSAPIAASLIVLGVIAAADAMPGNPYLDFYGRTDVIFFAVGVMLYYLYRSFSRFDLAPYRSVIGSATAMFSVFYFVWHVVPAIQIAFGYWGRYLHYVMPEIAVLLALMCHAASIRLTWKLPILLGGASYALYLCHVIMLELWRPLAEAGLVPNAADHVDAALFLLIICSAIAVLIHLYIEVPLHRRAKTLLIRAVPSRYQPHTF